MGFPQASLALDDIEYTDKSWDQIDIRIQKEEKGFLDRVKRRYSEYAGDTSAYLECPTREEIMWTEERIGNRPAVVLHYPVSFYEDIEGCVIDKGEAGGKRYFIEYDDTTEIVISKQARFEDSYEEKNFSHFIETFQFSL
jgi:hypothetical protein